MKLPEYHLSLPHRYSGCISLYKTMFEHSSEKQHKYGTSFHLSSLAGAYILLWNITHSAQSAQPEYRVCMFKPHIQLIFLELTST